MLTRFEKRARHALRASLKELRRINPQGVNLKRLIAIFIRLHANFCRE